MADNNYTGSPLPETTQEFIDWPWSRIEPYYLELAGLPLQASNLPGWLAGWTHLNSLIQESYWRLYVAKTRDTTDLDAEKKYSNYLDEIYPASQSAEQKLKEKLLASGLEPPGFELPLKIMRAETGLFHEDNLPLLAEEFKLASEYDKIVAAQTVTWDGREVTIPQLIPVYMETNRNRRESAWRLAADRQLEDREAINALWIKFMRLRGQLARNAGIPDYRSYRWQQKLRFDYTPEDCLRFHESIETVAVPAARRIYEKRRRRLGVDTLRPWDIYVDPFGRPPLQPFTQISELEERATAIFSQVDAQLGAYFEIMRREDLLDLDNRKGKAPGGYCTEFLWARRPFIFMNAVGIHDDVQTILHEGGHAFHVFERKDLPYHQQHQTPMEFNEVASMAMELLAAPYLILDKGGFYAPMEAARARVEHLEFAILFWPYMAVVDAFQHWVYTNHERATDPANCDEKWAELWLRFMPGVSWSGLEDEMKTGWHRKLHIFHEPLYYVEYGLAQLGAVQVWNKALQDQASAVRAYRKALSLGGSAPLSQLYATAGARLAFDIETLGAAVALMERNITHLEESQDWVVSRH